MGEKKKEFFLYVVIIVIFANVFGPVPRKPPIFFFFLYVVIIVIFANVFGPVPHKPPIFFFFFFPSKTRRLGALGWTTEVFSIVISWFLHELDGGGKISLEETLVLHPKLF
jgi:hypothetical protein